MTRQATPADSYPAIVQSRYGSIRSAVDSTVTSSSGGVSGCARVMANRNSSARRSICGHSGRCDQSVSNSIGADPQASESTATTRGGPGSRAARTGRNPPRPAARRRRTARCRPGRRAPPGDGRSTGRRPAASPVNSRAPWPEPIRPSSSTSPQARRFAQLRRSVRSRRKRGSGNGCQRGVHSDRGPHDLVVARRGAARDEPVRGPPGDHPPTVGGPHRPRQPDTGDLQLLEGAGQPGGLGRIVDVAQHGRVAPPGTGPGPRQQLGFGRRYPERAQHVFGRRRRRSTGHRPTLPGRPSARPGQVRPRCQPATDRAAWSRPPRPGRPARHRPGVDQ